MELLHLFTILALLLFSVQDFRTGEITVGYILAATLTAVLIGLSIHISSFTAHFIINGFILGTAGTTAYLLNTWKEADALLIPLITAGLYGLSPGIYLLLIIPSIPLAAILYNTKHWGKDYGPLIPILTLNYLITWAATSLHLL